MIGLLGNGKTGSYVSQLANNMEWRLFNSTNEPNYQTLKSCEAIIIFVPGPVLEQYLPILLESSIPVICGTTGFEYPENFAQQVLLRQQIWIHANNFSPAMSVVRNMIKLLGSTDTLLKDFEAYILERHHIHKKDAPSGTALSWREWLGRDCSIQADREGDIVGYHHLCLENPLEKITLTHESKDRSLFAKGALLALQWVLEGRIQQGFSRFEALIDKELKCNQAHL